MRGFIRSFAAYVGGLFAVQRGDSAAYRVAMRELENPVDSVSIVGLPQRLRLSLAAESAWDRAARDEAVGDLERAIGPTPFVHSWTAALLSQARERFLRAELLRERGRDDEALRWHAEFGENSPYDLVYLGPAM
jgi:hypothetical protein